MKKFNWFTLFIIMGISSVASMSSATRAQNLFISEDDISRLGIEFAPVSQMNTHAGATIPATIIHSPKGQSSLTARYAGTVQKWLREPGMKVNRGAVLAEIRSPQIVDIQQQWITANTTYKQASFERKKDQQLFDAGIIAQQRLEETKQRYQQAKFKSHAMQEKLRQAGFNDQARIQLAAGDIQPGIYFITAPADGTLSQKNFEVGDYIPANSQVASLQQPVQPWIHIKIPARLATNLNVGQTLGLSGTSGELILRQKDLQIDLATQTIELLAEFNHPTTLMPGQIVSVIVPPAREGILIPASAVVHTGNKTLLFIRTPNGVEPRALTLHPAGESYLATQGITKGEEIAIKGAALLKGIQLGLGGDE